MKTEIQDYKDIYDSKNKDRYPGDRTKMKGKILPMMADYQLIVDVQCQEIE